MSIRLLKLLAMASLFFVSSAIASDNNRAIAQNAELVRPILNGQTVPNTTLYTLDNKAVSLHDVVKDKPAVIVFYRGGWCPYCNAQLAGLKDIEKSVMKLGYQMIAVSPDSPEKLKEAKIDSNQKITLMSDKTFDTIKEFGIGFYMEDAHAAKYRDRLGVQFVDLDGTNKVALPVPAVYVVDKNGLVHFNYVNPNFKVRLEPRLLYQATRVADLGNWAQY